MAGAPPGAGVNVLGRQRIGPFDVTRLAANDPAVLANWLSDNGFPSPDGLEQNLAPYVADRWELVAIKLAPAEATGTMTGQLQPLTPSFTPDRVIFPMRPSRSAKLPQTVDAPHSICPARNIFDDKRFANCYRLHSARPCSPQTRPRPAP
jgi:hypothetical protein